ncbi:RICIN domain-containing protein [Streptomyces sp. BI20]|uniref:RICIN domain-containing protein n=1 Tax=Streptomyces sp. BI20 TaxID=3403460 RepID=UPI003C74F7B8
MYVWSDDIWSYSEDLEYVWQVGVMSDEQGRMWPAVNLKHVKINANGRWPYVESVTIKGEYALRAPDGSKVKGTFEQKKTPGSTPVQSWGDQTLAVGEGGAWVVEATLRADAFDNRLFNSPRTYHASFTQQVDLAHVVVPERAHLVAGHVEKVVNVAGASQDGGGAVDLWSWADVDQQKFRMDPLGNGHFRIIAKHSGKVLEIDGAWQDNETPLVQRDWAGTPNQMFRLDPLGGGWFRITAKHSGKALTVGWGKGDDGTVIHQWDWADQPHQRFQVRPLNDGAW